jgi:hypothetical protein
VQFQNNDLMKSAMNLQSKTAQMMVTAAAKITTIILAPGRPFFGDVGNFD